MDNYYANDLQRKEYINSCSQYIEKIRIDNIRRFLICQIYIDANCNILDFGAGYGLFPYLIKPFVASVSVIDKSKITRANAAQFGLKYYSDISELNSKYDLITAFHTLEHMVDPVTILRSLAVALSKNGQLIIEVPNYNDLLLKLSKKYTKFYFQSAHLHYFSSTTFETIAIKAGLTLMNKVPTQRYGLSNHLKWIFGFESRRKSILETLYKFIIARTGKSDTLFYVFKKK